MGRTRVEVCRGRVARFVVLCCVEEEKLEGRVELGWGVIYGSFRSWGGGRCSLGERSEELAAGEQGQ